MRITDRTARIIHDLGAVLFMGGGVLLALSPFEQLPNYLRLMVFFPFAIAVPMFCIEDYRGDWALLEGRGRGRAIGWLIIPVVVLIGVVGWYLADPSAKA